MELGVYLILNPAQHIKVHKHNAIYFMDKLEHINVTMMGQPHQLQLAEINYVQIYQEPLLVLVTHKCQDVLQIEQLVCYQQELAAHLLVPYHNVNYLKVMIEDAQNYHIFVEIKFAQI